MSAFEKSQTKKKRKTKRRKKNMTARKMTMGTKGTRSECPD
jgi:hypothetical protein